MQTRVEVYSAGDMIEANAVCEELAEVGIEAEIVGDNLQNVVGDLPFTVVGPRVWVADSDAEQARLIIGEWSRRIWPIGAPKQHCPTQFSLKSVFILITLAAIFAPFVQLMGGSSYVGPFACLLFYALSGTILIAAYRKKTAWRHEEEAVETEATESLPSDDPGRNG